MSLTKPVKIQILNQEYLIKGEGDDAQVLEIAQFVNRKFEEIQESTSGLPEKKIAILVAFEIANEYFKLLKERDKLSKEIQERVQALNSRIDSEMP